MPPSSGKSRFGSAEKALLVIILLVTGIFPYFPITAHGVVNWYVTGFDDLLIFAATFLAAKKMGRSAYAIAGLMLAVTCMLVLVSYVGKELSAFAQYAKWCAVVPLFYAAKEGYKLWKGEDDGEVEETWWMKYQMFGRAFFGFAANCLDDIALNTSMLAGAYSAHTEQYLFGIGFGAFTMVVLAAAVGNKIKDYPLLYVLGYLLAAAVILFL